MLDTTILCVSRWKIKTLFVRLKYLYTFQLNNCICRIKICRISGLFELPFSLYTLSFFVYLSHVSSSAHIPHGFLYLTQEQIKQMTVVHRNHHSHYCPILPRKISSIANLTGIQRPPLISRSVATEYLEYPAWPLSWKAARCPWHVAAARMQARWCNCTPALYACRALEADARHVKGYNECPCARDNCKPRVHTRKARVDCVMTWLL